MSLGFFGYVTAYLTLLLLLATGVLGSGNPKRATEDPRSTAIAYLIIFGAFLVTVGGGWLCNRIRDAIFPKATFAIGQGENRFHRQETIRWVVIVGFVVSLAAGYVPVILSR